MRLNSIPLNDIDTMMMANLRQSYAQLQAQENRTPGEVVHAVNDGSGGWIQVTTQGEEEYILYSVFVGKIHRESIGLEEAAQQRRRAWLHMAEQFVSEFGNDRTPPDITTCITSVREVFGI